jgi:hypothetical protein
MFSVHHGKDQGIKTGILRSGKGTMRFRVTKYEKRFFRNSSAKVKTFQVKGTTSNGKQGV